MSFDMSFDYVYLPTTIEYDKVICHPTGAGFVVQVERPEGELSLTKNSITGDFTEEQKTHLNNILYNAVDPRVFEYKLPLSSEAGQEAWKYMFREYMYLQCGVMCGHGRNCNLHDDFAK